MFKGEVKERNLGEEEEEPFIIVLVGLKEISQRTS